MSIGKESSSIWCFVGMNRERDRKKQTVAITRTFLCHEYQHRNKLKRRKKAKKYKKKNFFFFYF